MIRREIHASFPLLEHLDVAPEGHPFLIIVKEVRDFRGGRAVSAHELVFFVQSRPSKHQRRHAPRSNNSLMMPACCSRACGVPLPPRPVARTARCKGVDPVLFGCRTFAPPSKSARTAASDRVRTALCSGATPALSTALGSAPTEIRYAIVSACAVGSQRLASAA